MHELDWAEFTVDPAVKTALTKLQNGWQHHIGLHERRLVQIPDAFWISWTEGIHIFVDRGSLIAHHAIVHELAHALLLVETYQYLTTPEDECIKSLLSNELQHPEVFRRMKVYGLPMSRYWDSWMPKIGKASREIKDLDPYFNFARLFTWHFFPKQFEQFFENFEQHLREDAARAFQAVKGIDLGTPQGHSEYLSIFKDHWLAFCDRHAAKNDEQSKRLHIIQQCTIEPITVRYETEEEMMRYLSAKGLKLGEDDGLAKMLP